MTLEHWMACFHRDKKKIKKRKKDETKMITCQLCGGGGGGGGTQKHTKVVYLMLKHRMAGMVFTMIKIFTKKKRMKQRCGGNQNTKVIYLINDTETPDDRIVVCHDKNVSRTKNKKRINRGDKLPTLWGKRSKHKSFI